MNKLSILDYIALIVTFIITIANLFITKIFYDFYL